MKVCNSAEVNATAIGSDKSQFRCPDNSVSIGCFLQAAQQFDVMRAVFLTLSVLNGQRT